MGFWANLIGYQLVWFAIVISASRGASWLGIATAFVFIAFQLSYSKTRVADMRTVVAALACGFVMDGTLAAAGWLRYASPLVSLPAPVWILALWMAFAMTWNHSMRFLHGKPWLAALLGAVGGPLAYLGAARGFDAVTFVTPAWRAVSLLAVGWSMLLALLASLTQRWATKSSISIPKPEHA